LQKQREFEFNGKREKAAIKLAEEKKNAEE
jgi:hypothetical protein